MGDTSNEFKVYLATQVIEVSEKQWYEGEKRKEPVSSNDAFRAYIDQGDAARYKRDFDTHRDAVFNLCREHCGGLEKCLGVGKCTLENKLLHEALEDFVPQYERSDFPNQEMYNKYLEVLKERND